MPQRKSGSSRKANKETGVSFHPSALAENYLSTLYKLREAGEPTNPARLAEYLRLLSTTEELGTSLPSVVAMLRRMAREGFIEMRSDHEAWFTPIGLAVAEEIVRRHRLAERMLVDLLGLEWHRACIEGHRLEHAISSELATTIDERLGHPTVNPFGWPIPGSLTEVSTVKRIRLDHATQGVTLIVDRVPEEDPELLWFFQTRGVIPGERLNIVETGRYRGVLHFSTDMGEGAVDYRTASLIWLRES